MKNQSTIKQSGGKSKPSEVISLTGCVVITGLLSFLIIGVGIINRRDIEQSQNIKGFVVDNDFTEEEVNKLYALINDYRASNGLNALGINPKLVESAGIKNRDFVLRGYWNHYKEGESEEYTWIPFEYVGLYGKEKGYFLGENLATNYYTPEIVLDRWKESPTHNDNLLRKEFETMGINALCGSGECYITLHFHGQNN